MKKRWFSTMLLVAVLSVVCAVLLPMEGFASEVASGERGAEGDNLTWGLDDEGTLTISGTGAMEDYGNPRFVPWYSRREQIRAVVIEEGVTSIGLGAFIDCSSIVSVTIPDSVTTIGDYAFSRCSSLTTVDISDGVTYIGEHAFFGCSSLTSITIPGSVRSIGWGAFTGCSGLISITIPGSVVTIGDYAFSGCSSLVSVTILDGVYSIKPRAFSGCSSLVSITIPGSVGTIGGNAFDGCSDLWHVLYKGTERQWKNISVGSINNNLQLAVTTRHYNCTGDEVIDPVNKVCSICFANCRHEWDNGKIIQQPTCGEAGVRTYTCVICKGTGTETIEPTGAHQYGEWTVIAGANPRQEQKECTVCTHKVTRTLSSIMVTVKPSKLTYLEGENFSTAGMVVTAYYNNGTNALVTGCAVSGYSSTPGNKTITVSYGGKTASFEVIVIAKPDDVYRIYGSNRFDTAFGAANMLKETLGVEKFDNIIVACGTNFADALAGSYLGKVKNAPILLVQPNMVPAVREYIAANLQPGGTVYLLGGETIVPGGVSEGLNQFTTKRLWGANRYETNLAILEEAGVTGGEILVCTGYDFADSLSASAVGKPILLVDKKLTAGQEAYLAGLTNDSYVIVGGIGAVNQTVEASLRTYGSVERLAGTNRFTTSVMVAERFFEDPTTAVVAYAANFPDGLCGGPLAMSMGGPLLLTANNDAAITAAYTAENGIRDGVVLGGPGLISDAAVWQIFGMKASDSIVVK